MIIEFLLCFFTFILFTFFLNNRKPKNFPPGPRGLPIVGNLLQLTTEPWNYFTEKRKEYGDIFSVYFGGYPTVILNNPKVIRDAFNESVFAGRPLFEPFLDRSGGSPRGIIFNTGHSWTEQRRFTLKNLRDFGFGKKSMENLIQLEILELIETFKKNGGKPIQTANLFNAAVLNGLWAIVAGARYSHDDPSFIRLMKLMNQNLQDSSNAQTVLFFPLLFKLMKLFPGLFSSAIPLGGKELTEATNNFMKESIDYHKKTLHENHESRDFIDSYLKENLKTKDPQSSFHGEEGDSNLLVTLLDLFLAGAETSSTTLTWAFLYLSLNPKCQEKLFDEIKSVVGLSRLPSLTDRPNMPYTEAVVMETQRYSAMVPLGALHSTTEDVQNFHGYFIPKNTVVVANIYGVLHDPKIWGDPETFRPERFLSDDGKSAIAHEALIPFAIGKRVCPGETLAKDELFLFMTYLFQLFEVTTDPENPKPTTDSNLGSVLSPKTHFLIVKERLQTIS